MSHPAHASRHLTSEHCLHLRHKGMYVRPETGDLDPIYRDPIEATSYWCVRTQKAFGPDGLPAAPAECGDGRCCCESPSSRTPEPPTPRAPGLPNPRL